MNDSNTLTSFDTTNPLVDRLQHCAEWEHASEPEGALMLEAAHMIVQLRTENDALRGALWTMREQRDRYRGEASELRCRLDGVDITDD